MNPQNFAPALREHLTRNLDGDWSFVPPTLPPDLPTPSWEDATRLIEAERAVSELKGLAATLPNPYLLAGAFARREATLSSRIEGTQSDLRGLLLFESGDFAAQNTDAREISNYINAMEHGLERIREIPLCLNVMLEMHEILLKGDVRGAEQMPGRWRDGKVWIGSPGCDIADATYVPPPAPDARAAMNALEAYLHDDSPHPILVRLALVHYQFEAIHPFRDGNGRIGRLLIPLTLCERGFLQQPLLYLSAFFERNRDDYYQLLLDVSQHGRWLEWINFFVRGVAEEGNDAVQRARALLDLRDAYRARLASPRLPATTLRVLDELFSKPIFSITQLRESICGGEETISYNAVQNAVTRLEEARIVSEISGQQRNRIYAAAEILDVLQGDNSP